jgi:hypothetical protein
MASRLLDGKQRTVDVTPPPHITPVHPPCAGGHAKSHVPPESAAPKHAAHPPRKGKPSRVDDLLRAAGVKVREKK